MSSGFKSRGFIVALLGVVLAFMYGSGPLAAAQDQPFPKWEFSGQYSFFYPGADVHGVLPLGLVPLSSRLESNPRGVGLDLTYDFNRWFGLTLDTSTHWGSGEKLVFNRIDDAAFSNLSLGPKITFRHRHFSPFLEGLVGDHRLTPDAFHDIDKLGFMAGGGLDVNVTHHVALRLFRADYVFSNYRFGPSSSTPATEVRGVRLQAGLNFMFGGAPPSPPPSAACSVDPTDVFAGEPVTAHANGTGFNPKRTIKYDWSGNGGMKVAGTDASTTVDTSGLQPGPYQLSARLSDGSEHGVASCSVPFSVKSPRPPEISCSPSPDSLKAGSTAQIRSNASSPDNRRLSYSYSTSAGHITGTDATATLDTSGAQPGPITVTCNAQDDRNPALTTSATTTVMVETPPPPPAIPAEVKELETKLALHSVYFQTARPSEKNPDAGLMGSQEEVLKALASDFSKYLTYKPDAHLILSGHADSRGSADYNRALTQRRVDRTKSFLVEHGVPAGSIDVQSFGEKDQLTAAQVKQQMQENTDLSQDDRQKMLDNLAVIVMANNRRVDVSLSTTGQQSVRRYPFNAKDALALISTQGVEKRPAAKKKPRPKQ